MFKRLLGGPKTGTAKINSVVGQFEGMITELETGTQMNDEKIDKNNVEVVTLQNENEVLDGVNSKARNVRDALNAIVNGT